MKQTHMVLPTTLKWSRLKRVKVVSLVSLVAFACLLTAPGPSGSASSNEPLMRQERPAGTPRQRFDFLVREDFFAGVAGDQAALDRAMKVCEDTLAKNPKHAEAMVWHGAGLMLKSSFAFQKGDMRAGPELWDRGMKEMDDAAGLEPNNVGVRIARGATLLGAARYAFDKKQGRQMLEQGVADYESVLELQKPYFDKLSPHSRGELLFGLASGLHQLGNNEKARQYFQRVVNECQGSGREKQASAWLEKGALPESAARMTCTGCHKSN